MQTLETFSEKPFGTDTLNFLKTLPWKQEGFIKQSWPNWLHHMSPYAGRMTPQLAHWLIRCFSKKNEIVLDPFCGIGTVPLEANILERNSVGFDLNPYAYLVAKAKMNRQPLSSHLKYLDKISLKSNKKLIETVPEWVHEFYNEDTLPELLTLINFLKEKKKTFLLGCLVGVAQGHRVGHISKASALTLPYKPRPDDPGEYREVIPRLVKKVERMYKDGFIQFPAGKIKKVDSRKMPLKNNQIDCVVTSPPYLDNLDYVNANRLRLALLGYSLDTAKKLGSKLKYKEKEYLEMMDKVSSEISRVLKPKKYCIMIIGDVHNKKKAVNTADLLYKIFQKNNLKLSHEIEDAIPFNRSVQRTPNMDNASKPLRKDRILIMKNMK